MDFTEEKEFKYAEAFDLLLDAALAGRKYVELDMDSPIFLPKGEDYVMITEIDRMMSKGSFIHLFIPGGAEYLLGFQDLIEVKNWEVITGDSLLNRLRDAKDEYLNLRSLMDDFIEERDYKAVNNVAKEIRILFRTYDIIPWHDGELYFQNFTNM